MEPEEHDVVARPIVQDGLGCARGGEPPDRAELRGRISRYLEQHPDAGTVQVAGALMLPPSADELIEEVRAGHHRPPVTGWEREPGWRLDAIVDPRGRRCQECGHRWRAVEEVLEERDGCPMCEGEEVGNEEYPARGGGVDMVELYLPEQRVREQYEAIADAMGGVKQALYTCDCGMTVGPSVIVSHVTEHGLASEPERAADMVQLAKVTRGADPDDVDPEPYEGEIVPAWALERGRERSRPASGGEDDVEVDQETRMDLVRGAVLKLQSEEKGAKIAAVVEEVTAEGVPESQVLSTIDRFLRRGVVMETSSDRVRVA
jgi:predicted Zn-ribbon and HTH transcriptional regulator